MVSPLDRGSTKAGNTVGGLLALTADVTVRAMNDDKPKCEPKREWVRMPVNEIALEDCPFYRPGVKSFVGIGGMWELEFEDGHTEMFYEDGAEPEKA